ncbi:protein of unknown function [Lutibacter agarilyticus]|uniref:DUF4421 domain-containing protein n=1 Tax=Lutibacter agarilyticus TaxID=1109740 RepID=A0A238VC79_9FLAO|nr:DUF4421 family protein [Lutibacter agarilyticus]SNR31995.1 protein of unknown function [Lutibacter agarilyticus]
MNRQAILRHVILTVTFSLCVLISIRAQTTDSLGVKIEDGWIEKMGDKIAVDISLNNSYEIFEVKTVTEKFILYPNTPTNLRLKLNYKFISFGLEVAPKFIPGNGDEDAKGNTKSFRLGTSLVFKHWFSNLSYSKVKGYYLKNSNDFTTRTKGDPYIQFPDLKYKGFSFTLGYYSNTKFSLRSLTSQTERQLKSAGSFIPVFNFRYYTIDDTSSSFNTQKSNNFETSVGPGYAYTFVAKEKFYVSLNFQGSLGYLNTKLTTRQPTRNIKTNQDNFILRWDGKTGIGYNGDGFYTGLYANISGTKYKQENTTAINFETKVFYHLFLGIRFKSPSAIEIQMNKIENKLN